MKKILAIFSFVLFSALGFCQTMATKEDILSEMSRAGEIHNQSLDYFYIKLSVNSTTLSDRNVSHSDKILFIESIILNNDVTNPIYSYLNSQSTSPILIAQLKKIDSILLKALQTKPRDNFDQIIFDEIALTGAELTYYNTLSAIVSNNQSNLQNLEIELNAFNDDVFNHFGTNSNSTLALIAASAIAKSSVNYWFYNTSKWVSLTTTQTTRLAPCNTAHADVVGGVGSAIGGAVSGAVAVG